MKGAVEIKNLNDTDNTNGIGSAAKNNGIFSTAILATGPNQRTYGYQVLAAWLDGNLAVMPRNALYDSGEKAATAKARQLKEMADSENNAAIAAWSYLKEIAKLQGKSMPTWRASDVKIALKNTGGGSAGSVLANRLIKVTQQCLYRALATVKAGSRTGDIGAAIDQLFGTKSAGLAAGLGVDGICNAEALDHIGQPHFCPGSNGHTTEIPLPPLDAEDEE